MPDRADRRRRWNVAWTLFPQFINARGMPEASPRWRLLVRLDVGVFIGGVGGVQGMKRLAIGQGVRRRSDQSGHTSELGASRALVVGQRPNVRPNLDVGGGVHYRPCALIAGNRRDSSARWRGARPALVARPQQRCAAYSRWDLVRVSARRADGGGTRGRWRRSTVCGPGMARTYGAAGADRVRQTTSSAYDIVARSTAARCHARVVSIRRRWVLTVLGETYSRAPISRFVSPSVRAGPRGPKAAGVARAVGADRPGTTCWLRPRT
jgi:hypothetical protein